MPEIGEPAAPATAGRSLVGFYVAVGVVVALGLLGAWMWKPMRAWYRERQVVQAFMRVMDRRASADLKEVPAVEALQYVMALVEVSTVGEAFDGVRMKSKVTLQFRDVSAAVLLESWCSQVGANWTIAPSGTTPDGSPHQALVISNPARIAELESANPRIARLLRPYRAKLAEQMAGAKSGAPAK
jgi:hypothetical protein